ncbi:MAG: hypothetical protein Q8Q48_00380 [Candidatus Staskawiczbacteria bacterium]|nr:hypothetical protein [Candidatus Staskawiczbacteria bacterium]
MEKVKAENILINWFSWQFYEVPKFLLHVWNNYITFASTFFSFKLLLKTFFSPWRRYKWRYPKGLDITEFFNTLISNTFSRILGAMMRTILIIMGAVSQIAVALIGLIIFVGWILLPFLIIAGFSFAIFF